MPASSRTRCRRARRCAPSMCCLRKTGWWRRRCCRSTDAMPPAGLLDRLRTMEPDRHLSVLYAPEAVRSDIAALYAFDAEAATIRERVHEALPGEIRIQ